MKKLFRSIRSHTFSLLTLLIVLVGLVSIFISPQVKADATDDKLVSAARGWLLMKYFSTYAKDDLRNGTAQLNKNSIDNLDYVKPKDALPLAWNKNVGYLLSSHYGSMMDNQPISSHYQKTVDDALAGIGLNRQTFMAELGWKLDSQGSGKYVGGSMSDDRLMSVIRKFWPDGVDIPPLSSNIAPDWMQYLDLVAGIQSEKEPCTKDGLFRHESTNGNIVLVKSDGTAAKFNVQTQNNRIAVAVHGNISCNDAIGRLSDGKLANAYIAAVNSARQLMVSCEDKYALNAASLAACRNGFDNSDNAEYCNQTYGAGPVSNMDNSPLSACIYGKDNASSANGVPRSSTDSTGVAPAPSCSIDGIGWIVCPVMTFMGGVGDAAYGLVSNFLDVNSKIMDTSSGTFTAWQAFRDIANAAFVLVFLVVIYSQITSAGIGSYGVKKMLPRLVIGAILVNVSFFICQIMVDITQILGASLSDFLKNIPAGAGTGAATELSWGDLIPGVLTGVGLGLAAIGGGAILALSISAPVLIAFLLAILMTVVILIARQAAIVILVVLAPLAFVAYLLPNTEQLFKKWLKMFWALLLVYPVVALLYGGGALAARIIHNASNQGDFWLSITALGVSAIPLIMTPALLKGSMSATGALGAKLQGWGNKANAGVGKNIREKSRFGEASQGIKNKFALNRATRRANSRVSRAIDRGWVGKKLGLDRGSYAATEAVQKEATADAARTIKYEYDSDYVKALSSSNENVQAIAAGELVNRGEFGAKSTYDYLKNGGTIASVEMADALTKMKGAHAGLGEVGTAALKHFQSGNKKPFDMSSDDLAIKTEDGLAKLGNEALAKQSAAAIIEGSAAISATKASEVLGDARLRNSMTAETRQAFTNISNGTAANTGIGGNQPNQQQGQGAGQQPTQNQAPAGQTPAGTGGTPQQPTATPNNPSPQAVGKRAQAQAKLNTAAQGTAGTSPFFVASNGTTASSAAMATGSVKQANASQGSSGSGSRVFVVDRSGDTTEAPVVPPAEPTTIPTVEDSGRQTPGTIGRDDVQDYHDGMSR